MPVILATQDAEIQRILVQSQPGQIVQETLSQKYSTQKGACRVVQVAECLPSKHEAGRKEGRKEGWKDGRKEGWKEGRKERKKEGREGRRKKGREREKRKERKERNTVMPKVKYSDFLLAQ
jgi:hypothetical protein